jgi:hypothetical protein
VKGIISWGLLYAGESSHAKLHSSLQPAVIRFELIIGRKRLCGCVLDQMGQSCDSLVNFGDEGKKKNRENTARKWS